MEAEKTGENAGKVRPERTREMKLASNRKGADQHKEKKTGKKAETVAAVLKSCDMRPTAEEMFSRFMVSVAGRPLSVHQSVNEIVDPSERLTAEWLTRKDKFARK